MNYEFETKELTEIHNLIEEFGDCEETNHGVVINEVETMDDVRQLLDLADDLIDWEAIEQDCEVA